MRVLPPSSRHALCSFAGDVNTPMWHDAYQILIGDSSPETQTLLEQALSCCPSFALAHSVSDIAELVSYLAGAGKFVDINRFTPAEIVLLDLNLSGRASGLEVLKWVQQQPTRRYRVIVLSPASEDAHCEHAYTLGADGFVAKPRTVAEMRDILGRIEGWLRSAAIRDESRDFCVA